MTLVFVFLSGVLVGLVLLRAIRMGLRQLDGIAIALKDSEFANSWAWRQLGCLRHGHRLESEIDWGHGCSQDRCTRCERRIRSWRAILSGRKF